MSTGKGVSKGWNEYKTTKLRSWRLEHERPKKPTIPEVNINSSDQIKRALNYMYPDLNLENADKATLEELVDQIPEVRLLLELRKSAKIITTYGENLIAELDENDRLYPEYQQIKDTARMSANRIHQIPGKGELGKKLRRCFVPGDGHVFCIADYSQQEARICADLSNCKNLLQLFEDGRDIYAETIKMMLSLPEDFDVRKEEFSPGWKYRDIAKILFFGMIYGISPYGISKKLDIPVEKAEELMEAFFAIYPEIKRWINENADYAVKNLHIVVASGWRRTFDPLPELNRHYSTEEDAREARKNYRSAVNRIRRKGVNTLIQGLAASITKRSLIRFKELNKNYMKIVAVIHDEIIVETPEEFAEETAKLLSECMDYGSKYYLKKVFIPKTEVIVARHWRKE